MREKITWNIFKWRGEIRKLREAVKVRDEVMARQREELKMLRPVAALRRNVHH
jgi:hypothetical protein